MIVVGTVALAMAGARVGPGGNAEQPLKCPLEAAYDATNPFVPIITGKSKVGVVYRDQTLVAFVPISWDNPGEVLIVPRREVRNLDDLSDAEMLAIFHLIRVIARAQARAFGSTGYTIEENNGRHQTVCHAHFHVVPNTPKDHVQKATARQIDDVASRLRAVLNKS